MTTDKSFHDRVVGHLHKRRKRRDDDRQWFHDTCRYMSNAEGHRDHERLIRHDDGSATKTYLDQDIYTFRVKDGQISVHPAGRAAEIFTDRDQAVDRMAELVAIAVDSATEARNNPQAQSA